MQFLDLLAKLGILRYGTTAATYRSGTERPTELLMDNVYDAQRDLTVAKDDAKRLEAETDAAAGPTKH